MSQSVDVSTTYLGLQLRNPIVASSCPSNTNLDLLKQLEDAGIAAVVMPSLFEEQVEFEKDQFATLSESEEEAFAESSSFFPELDDYNMGPDEYLRTIEAAREAVSVPIFASLNGYTSGRWTRAAKRIEAAGAQALELNMYFIPTDISKTAESVESGYLELVAEVKSQISIPLAVKIAPYFSSLAHFAAKLSEAGADGLILFNRFMQPDIDLISMQVNPQIELSHGSEVRLPLRWIAILYGQVDAALAATSGIHTYRDVAKLLLAGADVTMIASGILRHGPGFVTELLDDLRTWMIEHDYSSVSDLRGTMSYRNCPDAALLERSNYMKGLTSYISRFI
jgi:dihydroorotate dehydrogenase (fumarate)